MTKADEMFQMARFQEYRRSAWSSTGPLASRTCWKCHQ